MGPVLVDLKAPWLKKQNYWKLHNSTRKCGNSADDNVLLGCSLVAIVVLSGTIIQLYIAI